MANSAPTIWASSKGILKQAFIACLLGGQFKQIKSFNNSQTVSSEDMVIGWGNKSNTKAARVFAKQHQLNYLKAESGFIGFLGHPSNNGHELSLIADDMGIFYDATQPSRLETLVNQQVSTDLLARANQLITKIKLHGITKYNCYANQALPISLQSYFTRTEKSKILIVDQIAGDLSIEGALASQDDFINMVKQARINHPNSELLLRTHPDTRFGKKKGVLASLELPDLITMSDACHPHALINAVDAVYTVSSQMGFEALLLNKPVYCFGMPFYAGWGLTRDTKQCSRRTTSSLAQLVAAALIQYPKYYDPILKAPCQVEDVIDLIALQYRAEPEISSLYMVNFSLWKRFFLKRFCEHLANQLVFVKKPPSHLATGQKIMVWGAQYSELQDCIRVEDGFIRSSGLGANLTPPSSLSFDDCGIYFNSSVPSTLEKLLASNAFSDRQIMRGQQLITQLKATKVSKYNTGNAECFKTPETDQFIILVVGQVDGDASIVTGSPVVKTNESLLWQVRQSYPQAYIIYKPHPDVVSGNRAGALTQQCFEQCVDQQELSIELSSLFPHIDELHTMTSLSGFEALIQGVNVVTWGQPFYSGWGLTQDKHPLIRRTEKLSLAALVYATLVAYPSYIDWRTGLWTSPERLITALSHQQKIAINKSSIWQRWRVKGHALFNMLMTK
jgi:capsular polysaccharide export protein